MPTYPWECNVCDADYDVFTPMDLRDVITECPECHDCNDQHRAVSAPAVMNVAMADGTRRFDTVRKYRSLERLRKKTRDKSEQARIAVEQRQVLSKGNS